jgi:hypothetical protein
MGVWESIKAFFAKVLSNITVAVDKLDPKASVQINEDGDVIVSETAVNWAANKSAAIVIAGAGMFFLLFPFKGQAAMTLGDQLVRIATIMWAGGS